MVHEEDKAHTVDSYYKDIMGTQHTRTARLNFDFLGLPSKDLSSVDRPQEEIWLVIGDMPMEKSPGLDGFTRLFYRTAWSIIKVDVISIKN